MSDKPEGLALLRVPFPKELISKLPKPMKKREEMDKLPKANCNICGGYHATSMVMHLDYVGHAALTDRLLDADPHWSWEPLAFDAQGFPALDKDGGLWIKLTVCGVTRLGYGDAQGKTGGDATKERIGDALRNAAMRFGAALDLWCKGDLHPDNVDTGGSTETKTTTKTTRSETKDIPMPPSNQQLHDDLAAHCLGDVEKMDTLLKRLSYYKAGDKEYSFGLDRLAGTSEKWITKVHKTLKTHIQAETQVVEFCDMCQVDPCVCGNEA